MATLSDAPNFQSGLFDCKSVSMLTNDSNLIPDFNILGTAKHIVPPKKLQTSNAVMSKPANAMKLFIGQIPKHMDESQLMGVFQLCGKIFDFVIHRDKITGEHQGSAFLVYCSRQSATKAIEVFHNKIKFNGMTSPLQVKPARGQTSSKLFVGMISRDTTEKALLGLFEQYGEIDEVHILRDKKTQRGKRCAFVKFRRRTDALEAIAGLRGKITLPGCSRPMVVKFAHREYVRDTETNHGAAQVPVSYPPLNSTRADIGYSVVATADEEESGGHEIVDGPGSVTGSPAISGTTSVGISSDPWPAAVAAASPTNVVGDESASPADGAITRADDAIKLFVGQIPKHMDKSDLLPMFEQCGPVFDLVVLRHKVNGTHQGSAFLTYCERDAALRAIDKFHNKVKLAGMRSPMQVKPAYGEQEHKLFVGMIPRTATVDDIHKLFGPIGEIEEVYILRDKRTLRSKGCAFVKYRWRANAVAAIATLHGTLGLVGSTRPLVVKFANSRRSTRSHRMQPHNRRYNRNAMPHPLVSSQLNWTGAPDLTRQNPVSMASLFQLQQMLVQMGVPKNMYPSAVPLSDAFYNPQSVEELLRSSNGWNPNSTLASATTGGRVSGFVDTMSSGTTSPHNVQPSSFMRAV